MTVAGETTLSDTLTIDMASPKDATAATAAASIHTNGGLAVELKTYLGNDLNVAGTSNLAAVKASSTLSVAGASTLVGTVTSTGPLNVGTSTAGILTVAGV